MQYLPGPTQALYKEMQYLPGPTQAQPYNSAGTDRVIVITA